MENKINPYSVHLLEGLLKTSDEYKYFQKLAEKFTASKGLNYHNASTIVLQLHIRLDRVINEFIVMLLDKGLREFGFHIRPSSYSKDVATITFGKKLDLIKGLRVFSQDTLRILRMVNTVRNAFAHGDALNNPRYKYDNTSVFTKSGIEKLRNDYLSVIKEYVEKTTGEVEIEKE